MKKIVALLMIAATFIGSASAQEARAIKSHRHHHDNRMGLKALNLTQDQKNQLKANRDDYRQQLAALDKNESITVKESRDQKEALRKSQKEKMMSVLTADQKNKLEQLKKDRQVKHEAMAAKRMDKMKAKLNLSDDQVAKINANRQAARDQFKAIAQNDQLSRTQKKEQLMALREQNKNTFKSILTPDQISKMEEMKKARMEKKQAK